ncbi:YaiO family outer membrane beta-barrel protein [Sporomusa malonica]|nr:YaiO family outer membrane beta-barrel protein [Sporomusa malonica]
MEISTSYEHLSPHADYGDWKTLSLGFYRKERPDLTWYTQLSHLSRPEGSGQLAAVGAFKDWSDSFYTYTSLSAGTESAYLPRTRVDNNFNFKFGPEKRLVGSVGGSYIQYFGDHKDYILSAGIMAYLKNSVAEYRIFRNQSDPGSVDSYSYLLSLSYGQDKHQWTTATFSSGKQAYLATYLATPQEVNQNSRMLTLNHRRWLGSEHGFFGDISYVELENSYHKTGVSLGFFREL